MLLNESFFSYVDIPELLNHKFFYFSQVKVMLSDFFSLETGVSLNDGQSSIRI